MESIADIIFEFKDDLTDNEYRTIMDKIKEHYDTGEKANEIFELVRKTKLEDSTKIKIFSLLLSDFDTRSRENETVILIQHSEPIIQNLRYSRYSRVFSLFCISFVASMIYFFVHGGNDNH